MADGQAYDALNIYATEPDALDAEEVRFLEELAAAVAFGLLSLRRRAEMPEAASSAQTHCG